MSDVTTTPVQLEARHLTKHFTVRTPGRLLNSKRVVRAVVSGAARHLLHERAGSRGIDQKSLPSRLGSLKNKTAKKTFPIGRIRSDWPGLARNKVGSRPDWGDKN